MNAYESIGVIVFRHINAGLQFLRIAGVRAVNIGIAGASHADFGAFFLQQLLHFFGNFKRYVFFARTVRADCPRVAAAVPGIKRNLFAFQAAVSFKLLWQFSFLRF